MNTTTTNKAKRTAAQVYAERFANVDRLLVRIAAAQDAHKAKAKADPLNWGFAGDLDGVEQQLTEALRMLGVSDDAAAGSYEDYLADQESKRVEFPRGEFPL